MIRAGDFKNGVTVEYKGDPFQIIEFQHVKPGKGSPFVRAKLKNIKTGGVIEDTFSPDDKLPKAHIENQDMQYLYADSDGYNYMNTETYEQIFLNKEQAGEAMKFVKEQEIVRISSFNGEILAVEPPTFVELVVTETEPGFKGNTATGATKPATVETGALVKVPLFVDIDDVIQIDTRTGEYLKRV